MNLFRALPFLLLIPFLSTSCAKQDNCTGGSISLDERITMDNVTVSEGENGLRYVILEPGGADKPVLTDSITVNYDGYTTSEDVFDSTNGTPRRLLLSNLIRGWQQGVPLIGEGGRIRLYIPANLGYGANLAGNICANTDLVFEIELVSF